jgi:hypothetical protein
LKERWTLEGRRSKKNGYGSKQKRWLYFSSMKLNKHPERYTPKPSFQNDLVTFQNELRGCYKSGVLKDYMSRNFFFATFLDRFSIK